MKIIQVTYDCSMITMILEDDQNSWSGIYNVLKESDDNFSKRGNSIFYNWSSDYKEECRIEDVTDQRGIIQEEHH